MHGDATQQSHHTWLEPNGWAIDAGAGGLLILDHWLYQRESRPRQVKRLLAKKAVAHIASKAAARVPRDDD